MNAIWQVLLALLAAVGLLALGWLTFGRLLTPVGGGGGRSGVRGGARVWGRGPPGTGREGSALAAGRRAGPLHHRHRRRRAGRYGAGGGRGPAGPRPGDRPLPGGAAGGVHQGMKGSAGRRTFFCAQGPGGAFPARQSGRNCVCRSTNRGTDDMISREKREGAASMQEAELTYIEGTVDAVIYQNRENGYTVLRLDAGEGRGLTVVGACPAWRRVRASQSRGHGCTTPPTGSSSRPRRWSGGCPQAPRPSLTTWPPARCGASAPPPPGGWWRSSGRRP